MEFISEIMYWFDVPNNIIIDNGTQFTVREFMDFCGDTSIKINYASVSCAQSCHEPHTFFTSIRLRGNVNHRGRTQIYMSLVFF
jgi:hypothetical protein